MWWADSAVPCVLVSRMRKNCSDVALTVSIHSHIQSSKCFTENTDCSCHLGDGQEMSKCSLTKLYHAFWDIWKSKNIFHKERGGEGSTVYTGAGVNRLRISLTFYSGCWLMQNTLHYLISWKIILKLCVENMHKKNGKKIYLCNLCEPWIQGVEGKKILEQLYIECNMIFFVFW